MVRTAEDLVTTDLRVPWEAVAGFIREHLDLDPDIVTTISMRAGQIWVEVHLDVETEGITFANLRRRHPHVRIEGSVLGITAHAIYAVEPPPKKEPTDG